MRSVALWALGTSVAFLVTAGAFLLLANLGSEPVALPDGAQLLVASGPVGGTQLPADTTVWLRG